MWEDPYGKALLGGQAAAMLAGLWPARRRWSLPWPVTAAATALAVTGAPFGLAAIARLGRRFRPDPMPAADAELQTEGVYGLVRHPMYTSLVVSGSGVALLRARIEPIAAYAALCFVLYHKIRHEERLLRAHFGASYEEYADQVPPLLPRPGR